MIFEGDKAVLQRLLLKKKLLAEGDPRHADIRPALLILSGVMRGVYGGGQITALERHGLSEVFDVAVGVSTGAPLAAYFLAGQAALGTTIYYEECTTPDFFSLTRALTGKGYFMDTEYLMRVFRGDVSHKPLHQDTVLRSRTQYRVGVTCAQSGEGVLLNGTKMCPDVVEAIHASLVVPRISRGTVAIGERPFTDGAIACRFPLGPLIAEYKPTDVLILSNRDMYSPPRNCSPLFYQWFFRDFPSAVYEAHRKQGTVFAENLAFLRAQREVRYGIIWTEKSIGRFERNPKKLRAAALDAETHLSVLLQEAAGTQTALT